MAQSNFFPVPEHFRCAGKLHSLASPAVVGILNITPDSFYDGGKFTDTQSMLRHVSRMIRDGAYIIDIGAQSTRPGSQPISQKQELKRLLPALAALKKKFPQHIFSVDTFYASVAQAAFDYGAQIINDISGGTMDKKMFSTVARLQATYILTHIRGTPLTMQKNPVYKNVLVEVIDFLQKRMARLRDKGIHDIIVDPGFGFGKSAEHNFTLLNHLREIKMLTGCPVMAGLSRKSMINKTLQITPDKALNGTTVLNTVALLNGASLLRVHDVKEAVQCVKLIEQLKK